MVAWFSQLDIFSDHRFSLLSIDVGFVFWVSREGTVWAFMRSEALAFKILAILA